MAAQEPILVTGAHRPGTTWAGRMLCAGTMPATSLNRLTWQKAPATSQPISTTGSS